MMSRSIAGISGITAMLALAAVAAAWPAHAQDAPMHREMQVTPAAVLSPAARDALRERLIRQRGVMIPPATGPEPGPVAPARVEAPGIPATTPLKPGDLRYVTLARDDEAQTAELARQALPDTFRANAAIFQGIVRTVDRNRREMILKAVAFPGTPLRLDTATGRFEGGISVGVVEVGGAQARALSAPIAFQVMGPVTAEPETVSVATTAPPYRTIRISADTPDPEVEVTVVSNVAPAGEVLKLKVRPSLAIAITPATIQGWGLETADVLVSAQGLRPGQADQVQLSATLGRLGSTTASLDQGGMAQVTLRSESTGTSQISAGGAGLDGATATVAYVFPWRFLGAALVGGIVGGLLRKRSRSRSAGAFAKSLGIAVLSAAVVVGLYVLGINLVGFALPAHGGEVLVFVVAALGALYGIRLLGPAPETS